MEDAINVAMFDFAFTCQSLIGRGWKFVNVEYGEARLGISSTLIIQRGNDRREIYHYGDLESVLEEDRNE